MREEGVYMKHGRRTGVCGENVAMDNLRQITFENIYQVRVGAGTQRKSGLNYRARGLALTRTAEQ